jgi:hypothetical protein
MIPSGDQDGKSVFDRHIFANPLQPEVCPVLALAIYVFTQNSFRSAKDGAAAVASPLLFVSLGAEDRFSKWMHKFLRQHKDEIEDLFHVEVEDFGKDLMKFDSHSIFLTPL